MSLMTIEEDMIIMEKEDENLKSSRWKSIYQSIVRDTISNPS